MVFDRPGKERMPQRLLVTATVAVTFALVGVGSAQRPTAGQTAPAQEGQRGRQEAGVAPRVVQQGEGPFVIPAGEDQIRLRDIRGAVVVDGRGEELGQVQGVILDGDGRLIGAVVGVGGFLGVGEKSVGVPWRDLRAMPGERPAGRPVTLALDRTRPQLRSAPEYRTVERLQADEVVDASRQRMLDKQERGVLQRALQALDRADQALQLQDHEAARAALAQARQALEQAIATQEQQPAAGPEPPAAAGQARQP